MSNIEQLEAELTALNNLPEDEFGTCARSSKKYNRTEQQREVLRKKIAMTKFAENTPIDDTFSVKYNKEDDFNIGRFLDGNDTAKENLLIIESHTDEWVDHYVKQEIGCNSCYFHKSTMFFNLLGNFDTNRNKKDMKYDSNTVNHMWLQGKTKEQIEAIVNRIKGKKVYAVWDFDYLIDLCVNNHDRYYTNIQTFARRKDAESYLKKSIAKVKQLNKQQKVWDMLKHGRAYDMFVATNKSFREVHVISIPDNINVFGIEEFINTTKDFFKPIFLDAYKAKVQVESQEFLKDSFWFGEDHLDIPTMQKYYQREVLDHPYASVMVRGKKKIFQNNVIKFKQHIGVV